MSRLLTPAGLLRMREELKLTVPAFAEAIGCKWRFYTYREQGQKPIELMFSRAVRDAYRELSEKKK